MAEPSNILKGMCRIAQDGAGDTFLANSGMFYSLTHNGDGDTSVTIDEEFRLNARDTFDPEIEGRVEGVVTIERISETQIRLRAFTADGVPENFVITLVCNRKDVG